MSICSVYAIDIDLSKYSDDEISELFSLLQQEMIDRKIVKQAKVPSGKYIIGKDIPAGKYVFTKVDISKGCSIWIYNDDSSTTLGNTVGSEYIGYDKDEEYIAYLKDGNLLSLDGAFYMKVFTGIVFE